MTDAEIRELTKALEEIDMRTKRIERALLGDAEMGVKGIAYQVKCHSISIEKLEDDRKKVITGAITISAIIGAIWAMINKII